MLTTGFVTRRDLQIPRSTDLGVHDRLPYPKRLPAMADIWDAHASAAMAMDRQRE